MFPHGPQSPRPMRPPHPITNHMFMQPPMPKQPKKHQGILSMFKTSEGNIDFEKITGTVEQINKLYGQFSPLITKFMNKSHKY